MVTDQGMEAVPCGRRLPQGDAGGECWEDGMGAGVLVRWSASTCHSLTRGSTAEVRWLLAG